MKVLMVGVLGKYAGLVLPELKKRGALVRGLIRSEDKAEAARQKGADEVAVGDLDKPDTLPAALDGVDAVFHINPAFEFNEADLGVHMVEAAKAAGTRRFVFSSVIHPSISAMRNHAGKRPVEEALYESGMDFTVLQPTMFMQTLANSWPQVVETGRFALPYSVERKASYVDYRDVAEAAALALTGDTLAYGTFELCAPGMVDRRELAAIMGQALGRPVEAGEVPFDRWADTAKIPESPFRDGMAKMYANYDKYGFPGGNALVLRAILGREPRSLAGFFADLAAQRA